MTCSSLPALLQGFFTERLQTQLGASSYTVATYRDTFLWAAKLFRGQGGMITKS